MTEPRTEAGKALVRRWDDMEGAIGVGYVVAAIEREAVRGVLTTLRDDLRLLDPDSLPVPIGRVRRKWWRLGMLSGWAVAADLTHWEHAIDALEQMRAALAALDEVKS